MNEGLKAAIEMCNELQQKTVTELTAELVNVNRLLSIVDDLLSANNVYLSYGVGSLSLSKGHGAVLRHGIRKELRGFRDYLYETRGLIARLLHEHPMINSGAGL